MTPTQRLKKIGAIFETVRKDRDGYFISTNAYYNLLGAEYDLKRTRKADKIILGTIREVLSQLSKMGHLLDGYTVDPTRRRSVASMTLKHGRTQRGVK